MEAMLWMGMTTLAIVVFLRLHDLQGLAVRRLQEEIAEVRRRQRAEAEEPAPVVGMPATAYPRAGSAVRPAAA